MELTKSRTITHTASVALDADAIDEAVRQYVRLWNMTPAAGVTEIARMEAVSVTLNLLRRHEGIIRKAVGSNCV